ncbi:MAG: oligoribonuclease [Planctomycetes bacterium]|nr:oligoribonuclease [Planctomycetota bacterium]
MTNQNEGNLVWIDLEMTGLEIETRTIIEIASIVTDGQLQVLAEGPDLVIHQPDEYLDAMDDWNQRHHGGSGLTQAVRESTVTMAEAEEATLEFLRAWVPERISPLCGNSVHNDRLFLAKFMPRLHDYMHYRNIDVSTVKELGRRWYGDDVVPPKSGGHRALADIRESIDELRHYRRLLFRAQPGETPES